MDPFAEEQTSNGSGFDPRQLLRLFLRRKWLFIVPFFLCLAMAGVAIKIQTPIYYSSAQIHVVHEATSVSVLPREVSRYGRRDRDREVFTNIQIILTGPKFLESVVREINIHRWDTSLPDSAVIGGEQASLAEDARIRSAANRLHGQIRVQQDGAHLFSIGVRDPDPQRAYLLTRVILDRFLEEERATRLAPATTTRDFLERQREVFAEELSEAENRLHNFQRSMLSETLAGNPINEQNLTLAETSLSRLRTQFFDSETSELFAAEREAKAVLGSLPSVVEVTQDSEIASLVRELATLEYEQALGLATAGGQAARQDAIGTLRIRLNGILEARTTRQYPQLGRMDRNKVSRFLYLRVFRDVHQQVISRFDQDIQAFKEFTTRQPEQSAELTRLQQEVETAREMLLAIRRDISQENLRLEASLSEIGYKMVVRRDPRLPTYPIEPNKVKLAFLGFVLAFCLGGGLVVLAHLLDRSFHSVAEIEKTLGLAVIGTLPVVENEFFAKQRLRRVWTWTILTVAILMVAAAGLLFLYPRLS